ncbi:hypothetical protein BJ684DRAFT_22973 [Piptocephalis cylindrospora]|uniref:Cytochrome b5 heme-binding domain-containing protein n=1 Tax=Piptocephalis cylindrospora TaxID=1907219 RepID=A0A4P9Y231_9FUNG|nr:hypothetical protein BJ684DRAFT_22973 [Piptocephalis cylindrospora]|eukprot:RKP12734.1 hypothetical protein BJ684DRAFT_22973 [Piptocephalis cylindrospora]
MPPHVNSTPHLPFNYLHLFLLTLTPCIALRPTVIFSIIYYWFTGLGITAGYHRYWSHRSYDATPIMRLGLMFAGSGAFEGSIQWWSRGHRAHHRHTDTDKDPYSALKGLFWSHIGWMIYRQPYSEIGYADIRDLKADRIVAWQHRNYLPVAIFAAFIFPTLVAGFGWGDWAGGYFYAGVLRLVLVHHATFCINSLAHYLGDTVYDDLLTARDNIFTALVTFGEGYHNFHHEFPMDYRNAIRWYEYDPTKWLIRTCAFLGLAYDLRTFPHNEVAKGKVTMLEKKLQAKKDQISWGTPLEQLPAYTMEQFRREVSLHGHSWTVIEGAVIDYSSFIDMHPGGKALLRAARGRDATDDFNGTVHQHRHAARNLITSLRVARIVCEED